MSTTTPAIRDVPAAIAAGRAEIASLPGVIDSALVGSACFMPAPKDIDFVVLLDDGAGDVQTYAFGMESEGWEVCGDAEYEGDESNWIAVRREGLNLMLSCDPQFFGDFKRASEVCIALNLTSRADRVDVHKIVMHGATAAELGRAPLPAALAEIIEEFLS